MRTISRRNLEHLIATDPSLVIIEALPAPFYRKAHLPSAITIPHDQIVERAPALIPDRAATIVTYCVNAACENSRLAAQSLEAIGYTNLFDYAGGKQDWMAAGLPVERSARTRRLLTSNAMLPMVSCSLEDDELAARSDHYRKTLFAAAHERRKREDGYAFRFAGDGDWRGRIDDFVSSERRCCSFFQIDVSYGAGLGPIWLTLTGPEGTKAFIEDTFDVPPHA